MRKVKMFVQYRTYMALYDAIKKKTGFGMNVGKLVNFLSEEVIKNEPTDSVFCGPKFYIGAKPTKILDEEALRYDRLSMEVLWSLGYEFSVVPMYPKDGALVERGLDVALACDAAAGAAKGEFNVVVLFVADTDYSQLLSALKKLGVIVYVVSVDQYGIYTAAPLKRDADVVISLGDMLENDSEILDSLLFK